MRIRIILKWTRNSALQYKREISTSLNICRSFRLGPNPVFESDLGFFLKGRRLDPVDLEMDPNLRSVPCICLYIDLSV